MRKNKKHPILDIQNPRIGLALGSGGARGLAHVGVIKELVRNNVEISAIAGTSAGALVGALYALHKDTAEVEKKMTAPIWKQASKILFDVNLSFTGGILQNKRLADFIEQEFGTSRFYNLKIPFAAVATRLRDGQKTVFSNGRKRVGPAVLASMAFPFVFPPIKIDGERYIDGGLVEAVPVPTVKALDCDIVIAVNLDGEDLVHFDGSHDKPFDVLQQSINVYRNNLARFNARSATIKVEPVTGEKGVIGWDSFARGDEIVKSGEKAMRKQMPLLKHKILRFGF